MLVQSDGGKDSVGGKVNGGDEGTKAGDVGAGVVGGDGEAGGLQGEGDALFD